MAFTASSTLQASLYDRLVELEKTTGIVLANSPTVNVGYEVLSDLPKENHDSPMLSLDKTKEVERLKKEEKRLEGELKRVNGMLNNEKFVSKAPEAKIQEERAKLEKYTDMMNQVKERLAQLVK